MEGDMMNTEQQNNTLNSETTKKKNAGLYDKIIKHLAKSILKDSSKEYFKIVSDQIFVYNHDTGLFESFQGLSKECLAQVYGIYSKKYVSELTSHNKSLPDYMDEEVTSYPKINFKDLCKEILHKLNSNKNLYCEKYSDNVKEVVIPLSNRKILYGNKDTGRLKPSHTAFASLDHDSISINNSGVNRVLSRNSLQEYPYIHFLQSIQNSDVHTENIGFDAKMLFKDIAVNVPTYSGKMCYVISCDDIRMRELFWVPLDNMVPSSYKTYMSFHNSEVRKHASHMIGKAINVHFGLPSEVNKNQKMFLCENLLRCVPITLFYPKSSYNYINRTIQVFLVNTSEAERLMNIFEEFGVSKLAQLIKLPQIKDLEKSLQDELNEPDFIEELLSDKDGIINLLYSDWSETDDNEALQELTYTDSKEDFVEKYLEFTGKESDIVSKKELYQNYCQSYPNDYIAESVFSKFLKNYNFHYINRTSFKKMDTQKQAEKFTDIKRDGVSHWVGLKIKE